MKIATNRIIHHTELESSYVPVALRRQVLKQGNYTCFFCQKKGVHSVCHKVPKCRGGLTEADNLLICCEECRRQKEELTAEEYLDFLTQEGAFKKALVGKQVDEKVGSPVTVFFKDGEVLQGRIYTLPGKTDTAIYIYPDNENLSVYVNLEATKKVEVISSLPSRI